VFTAGHGTKMFAADPRQVGNLVFCENFLIGFYSDHFPLTFLDILGHSLPLFFAVDQSQKSPLSGSRLQARRSGIWKMMV
jgi:hypothetical protein